MQKRMDILDSFREKDYISNLCVWRRILSEFIKKDQDPVYKDSAMEAFFQFKGNDTADEM